MTRQRLRESSVKWNMVLSVDSFSLKVVKKGEELAFSNKAKIVNINVPSKVKEYIKQNLEKEINHFKKKYKIEFNIISDENLKVYHIEDFSSTDTRRMRSEGFFGGTAPTSTENTSFSKRTGWISGPDLGKRMQLRRLNIKHKSGGSIYVFIYIDGNDGDTGVVRTLTIPANSNESSDWYRCAPGVRGRQFMLQFYSPPSDEPIKISRIEVEIE